MRGAPRSKVRGVALVLALAALLEGRGWAQGRAGGLTEEEQAFQAAEAAFKENRDDEAMRLYGRVSNINPARSEAYMKRAVIFYKRRQYPEAAALLDRAREILPNDPALQGQLGLTLYRMNRIDKAVALLEQAVKQTPEAYQLQLQLGQHYVKVGDGKRAVTALEAYFKARPETAAAQDLQIRAFSGTAYYENQQYAEAQRDLEAVVRVDPRDISSRATLGAVYTARGDWSRGVALFEALGANEAARQPFIHENLAICYQKLHRLAEAEKEATLYAMVRQQDARGFLVLGDIRAARKDRQGAISAWAKADSLDPKVGAAGRQARALLADKHYAEARDSLEEARRDRPLEEIETDALAALADAYAATQQPRDKLLPVANELTRRNEPEAQLGAGIAYYAAADDDKAVTAFTNAVNSPRTRSRARGGLRLALNRRAGSELAAGNAAAAEKTLRAAQAIDPSSVVTARNLAVVLMTQGRYAEAEKALAPARQRVEGDPSISRLLGRAALGQGRRDEALRYLESAAQAAQKVRGLVLAEVFTELGPLYAEAQRYDQAVSALDTAVKEAGRTPVRDLATRNLAFVLMRRGLARLSEGKENRDTDGGVDDLARAAALRGGLSSREVAALGCAYALGSLKAGRSEVALEALSRATREGGCTLKAPYDKIGLELFSAYATYREGSNPARKEAAARTFQKLQARAPQGLADTLHDLTRSCYEYQGVELYQRGDRKRAEAALKGALRVGGRGEHRELDHNLAVLDLEAGRVNEATRTLEQLGGRPPEALVNLGVLKDREGDSRRALEYYKRALDRGARSPHLREWVDVKERVFAKGAAGAPAGGGR